MVGGQGWKTNEDTILDRDKGATAWLLTPALHLPHAHLHTPPALVLPALSTRNPFLSHPQVLPYCKTSSRSTPLHLASSPPNPRHPSHINLPALAPGILLPDYHKTCCATLCGHFTFYVHLSDLHKLLKFIMEISGMIYG